MSKRSVKGAAKRDAKAWMERQVGQPLSWKSARKRLKKAKR